MCVRRVRRRVKEIGIRCIAGAVGSCSMLWRSATRRDFSRPNSLVARFTQGETCMCISCPEIRICFSFQARPRNGPEVVVHDEVRSIGWRGFIIVVEEEAEGWWSVARWMREGVVCRRGYSSGGVWVTIKSVVSVVVRMVHAIQGAKCPGHRP